MNARLGFWLVFAGALANAAEPAEQTLKLTGIVVGPKEKHALVEKHRHRSSSPEMLILRQGERWDGNKIISIDEKTGVVKFRESKTGRPLELKLNIVPGQEMAQRTFPFQGANLRHVLEVYQMWSGRTVLAPVALPPGRLDLKSGPALGNKEAIETLERALADKGLFTKPHGDKFVFGLRTNQVQIPSFLAKLPVAGAAPEETFPPGLAKFMEADLFQVLPELKDELEKAGT